MPRPLPDPKTVNPLNKRLGERHVMTRESRASATQRVAQRPSYVLNARSAIGGFGDADAIRHHGRQLPLTSFPRAAWECLVAPGSGAPTN